MRSPVRLSVLALATVLAGVTLVACSVDEAPTGSRSGDNPPIAAGPVPVPSSASADDSIGAAGIDLASLDAPVAAQIEYALTYWSSYNPAYQHISPTDCVNFTSQTLLERGWTQNESWFYDADDIWDSSSSWLSSTSFKAYLEGRPDLAVALDDTQRDQVAVGDVVQFDWDDSGDRDHTGVVTRVEGSGDDIRIYYAGHTLDSDFRGVDESIMVDHPGGVAYYWHILTP